MYSSIICTIGATYCISRDYNVHVLGDTEYYTFNKDFNNIPILIKDLYDIKMIDCGLGHILCLDFNGSVFSFGNNYSGELGLGKGRNELEKTCIPQRINISSCKQIACGSNFSMCLTKDELLYSFGNNNYGALGLGSNHIMSDHPKLIPNFNNIEYIVCGCFNSICKTHDNTYYGWGSNDFGQIGHDMNSNYYKPTLCKNFPDNIISIKCSSCQILLLTLKGIIYYLGDRDGILLELNDNDIKKTNAPILITNIPEIRRIECGYDSFMFIDINNHLWVFGENNYGQLGLGDKKGRYKPIRHPILSNVIDISSKGFHTFVKTLDGKIYAFGENDHSQLGVKTNKNEQLTPIQVFRGNEDIWGSLINKNKQKSARK